ncbi:hypothetical protein B0H19DRAFT_1063170 [Mycena capillaripes]|nr:hypothetical protein B0H19DRAFT_1063170 [Mycena capillaripes]
MAPSSKRIRCETNWIFGNSIQFFQANRFTKIGLKAAAVNGDTHTRDLQKDLDTRTHTTILTSPEMCLEHEALLLPANRDALSAPSSMKHTARRNGAVIFGHTTRNSTNYALFSPCVNRQCGPDEIQWLGWTQTIIGRSKTHELTLACRSDDIAEVVSLLSKFRQKLALSVGVIRGVFTRFLALYNTINLSKD